MLELLWGIKTLAMFDVWSIEHILSGLSVGRAVNKNHWKHLKKLNNKLTSNNMTVIRFELIGVLFIAYLWETIEHYLELGLAGPVVAFWFQGAEHWTNRLIADPLMLVLGYYIAKRYPRLVIPARILSLIWLAVHIFVFPHSMYLHQIL